MAAVARDNIAKEFAIHLDTEVELAEAGRGIDIRWDGGSVTVDKVIAAVGRQPNVDGLGLETLGVPTENLVRAGMSSEIS